MRKLLPFAAAAPLALAACQPAAPDPRGVDHDETLLTVSATGKSETRPDEARFTLGVETLASTAREASRLNSEKMARVVAALRGFGVEDRDLQTRTLALGRIDYGRDRGRYRAANQLEVRLRDLSRVSDAVTATTEAGANLVGGPGLVVSDREQSTRSAYAEAYRAARQRADSYAGAAGLKVVRVLTIRDGGSVGIPMPIDAVAAQAMAPPAPPPPPVAAPAPFNPGVNRETVAVSVAFALAPK